MLHQLRREGYKLAVCSNSIRASVELMLEASGIFGLFDVLVSNEDVQHPKPDPGMYLKACVHMGVVPQETVMVEDAEHGITAAVKADGRVCKVSGFEEVNYARIRRFIEEVEREK